jgi:hypothetical protein
LACRGRDQGESYFVPAGALECVAPLGGANWAAAQEKGGSDLFSCLCFFVVFSFFYWLGFAIFIWFQLFLSLLEFELF